MYYTTGLLGSGPHTLWQVKDPQKMSNSGGIPYPQGGFHTRLPMVLPTRNSKEVLTTKKTSADIGPLRLAPFDKLLAPQSPPKSQEVATKIEENDCDEIMIVESDLDGK